MKENGRIGGKRMWGMRIERGIEWVEGGPPANEGRISISLMLNSLSKLSSVGVSPVTEGTDYGLKYWGTGGP